MLRTYLEPILTRQSDSLVSIGLDPPTLLAFKLHAGLPGESTWTEADNSIQGMLSAAEDMIDDQCGTPYRLRSYQYQVQCIDGRNRSWLSVPLPVYPISSVVTIAWTDDIGNHGTYVQGTDFQLVGPKSLNPNLLFPLQTFRPITAVRTAYPFTLTFTAGPGLKQSAQRLAIFQLAAFFYRYPEAMFDKQIFTNPGFQNILDSFSNSFL